MNLVEWMQRTGEVRRLRRQHDEADERERELRDGVITDLIQHSPDGPVFAGVTFPDGHVEVHRVQLPSGEVEA